MLKARLLLTSLIIGCLCSANVFAQDTDPVRPFKTPLSSFIYDVAIGYHEEGRDIEAIDHLKKLMMLNPYYPGAMKKLIEFAQKKALRDAIIDSTLARLSLNK